jgi:hypothetical protein
MQTLQLLRKIHEANFEVASSNFAQEIKDILEKYGWLSDTNAPPWFLQMLRAVSECRPTTFDFQFGDDAVESDAGSIIIELQKRLSWQVEDFGEWAKLRFPGTRMEVLIVCEGGGVCVVRRRDTETWADWETWNHILNEHYAGRAKGDRV